MMISSPFNSSNPTMPHESLPGSIPTTRTIYCTYF
jgi:hypothetical protein